MLHALAAMRSTGVAVVGVGTGDDAFHAAARSLYESLGFTKIPIAGYLMKVWRYGGGPSMRAVPSPSGVGNLRTYRDPLGPTFRARILTGRRRASPPVIAPGTSWSSALRISRWCSCANHQRDEQAAARLAVTSR